MENTQADQNIKKTERFTFTGKGSEYFGIWIVNILLTIVTLGLYSAWAKVRNKQYFYGNTFLNDSSFEYTANPVQILKGRLVAVAALVLYQLSLNFAPTISVILLLVFALAIPWVIMKSLAFNARYSQYRNIRFSFNQNTFEAYKVMFLIPLAGYIGFVLIFTALYFLGKNSSQIAAILVLITGLAMFFIFFYPFVLFIMAKFKINNHSYGESKYNLNIDNANPYRLIYLKITGLSLLAAGILSAVFIYLLSGSLPTDSLSDLSNTDKAKALTQSSFLIIPVMIIYITGYAAVIAYVKARTYNLLYSNTSISKHKLRANMSARSLTSLYVTNSLGIIFTLGIFTPWALVRTAKFKAKHTALQTFGSLDDFVGTQQSEQNPLGEELGEVFDLDIGI